MQNTQNTMSDPDDFGMSQFTSTQLLQNKSTFANKLKAMSGSSHIHELIKKKASAAQSKSKPARSISAIADARVRRLPKLTAFDDEVDSSYHSDNKSVSGLLRLKGSLKTAKSTSTTHDSGSSSSEADDAHIRPSGKVKEAPNYSSTSDSDSDDSKKKKKRLTRKAAVSKETISDSSSEESDGDIVMPVEKTKQKVKTISNTIIKEAQSAVSNKTVQKRESSSSGSSSSSSSDEETSPKKPEQKAASSSPSSSSDDDNSDAGTAKKKTANPIPPEKQSSARDKSSSGSSATSSSSSSSSGSSSSSSSSSEDELPKKTPKQSKFSYSGGALGSDHDSDSSDQEGQSHIVQSNKKTNKLLEDYSALNRLHAIDTTDCLNLDALIGPDDEVFILKVCNEIDKDLLLKQALTCDKKQSLTIHENKYCVDYDKDDRFNLTLLGTMGKNRSYGIKQMRTKGSWVINRAYRNEGSKLEHLKEDNASSKKPVQFPSDKLETRHPLFGRTFEQKLIVNEATMKKLEGLIGDVCQNTNTTLIAEKKRKKAKKATEHQAKNETSEHEVMAEEIIEHKIKKKKKSKNKDEVKASNFETILSAFSDTKPIQPPLEEIVTKSKKNKKEKKHKKDKEMIPEVEIASSKIEVNTLLKEIETDVKFKRLSSVSPMKESNKLPETPKDEKLSKKRKKSLFQAPEMASPTKKLKPSSLSSSKEFELALVPSIATDPKVKKNHLSNIANSTMNSPALKRFADADESVIPIIKKKHKKETLPEITEEHDESKEKKKHKKKKLQEITEEHNESKEKKKHKKEKLQEITEEHDESKEKKKKKKKEIPDNILDSLLTELVKTKNDKKSRPKNETASEIAHEESAHKEKKKKKRRLSADETEIAPVLINLGKIKKRRPTTAF